MRIVPRPFRDLEDPRQVLVWGLYDLANQSFTLLIITLLFSLYVREVVVEGGGERGAFVWSLMHGGSLLLVVLLSPFLGALADARGWRKQFLIGSGVLCACLTCALALVGPGAVLMAALLYMPANICFQLGENFLGSFLPLIASPRQVGRVSAIAWTMGYVGALALLVLTAGGMAIFDLREVAQWRPFFVFAGLWFLLGLIPAAIWLRDDPPDADAPSALTRLRKTLQEAGRYRQLARFLIAFCIYSFGVQVIVGFASIIASDFGFRQVHLVLFVAQLTVVAGIASALTSRYQDRIGAKATIAVFLVLWVASAGALILIRVVWQGHGPQWPLWMTGNLMGLALGGIGTASRAMVARFTPRHRSAEFFALWGVSYKLAGAVGVLAFGGVARAFGQLASLVLLLGFFVLGFVLLTRVNERAGLRSARRAQRDHA